jgi:hypothetical protein
MLKIGALLAEAGRLAKRSKLRIGPLIAVGILTLVLCLGVGSLYVGWGPGSSLTGVGYVAMGIGLAAAILLGVGLALLIHHNERGR